MGTSTQNILLMVLVAAFVAFAVVVEFAPPMLSFGLVALLAVTWCTWLDSHPIQ